MKIGFVCNDKRFHEYAKIERIYHSCTQSEAYIFKKDSNQIKNVKTRDHRIGKMRI